MGISSIYSVCLLVCGLVQRTASTVLCTREWNHLGAANVCSQYLGIPYTMKFATDVRPKIVIYLIAGASLATLSSIFSARLDQKGLRASGAPKGTPNMVRYSALLI